MSWVLLSLMMMAMPLFPQAQIAGSQQGLNEAAAMDALPYVERRARRKPNSNAARYRPQENGGGEKLQEPSRAIDEISSSGQSEIDQWQQAGAKELNAKIIDENYDVFVESLSILLNSLGDKQLSRETRTYLESIPAGKLQSMTRMISPEEAVEIIRGQETDFFAETKPDMPEGENGLMISIKQPGSSILQMLQTAHDALSAGQTEGAAALYKQVLMRDPRNTQALFGLAASYHKRKQLNEARDLYLALLKLDPHYAPAINNMLMLAREEGPDEALQLLFKLEQANPEFPALPAQIGMIYFEQGKLEDAAKYLTRAVVLAPEELNYRYNLAVVLDKLGNTEQAARLYIQLIKAGAEGKKLPESVDRIQERLTYIRSKQGEKG